MQRRENFLPFFLFFFGLSLLLILLGRTGIINSLTSFINKQAFPIRSSTIEIFSLRSFQNKQINALTSENLKLKKDLSDKDNLLKENKALRSQFENTSFPSQTLLPAKVIGSPGFIPGVSLPEYLIIDKGLKDDIVLGDTVVVGNNLVGKVVDSTQDLSKVELVSAKNSSFTAKVEDQEETSGIIKGQGTEEMVLENILLTHILKKGGLVLTKGNIDLPSGRQGEKGIGYPPDIVVGKITGVEKKESELFQKAEVVSFVDFTSLSTVFVIK